MKSLSVLAAIAVVLVAAAATPSEAAMRGRSHAYDGLWSVSIRTQVGPCDPSYRYPARIVDGRIVQADNDFSYQISGAVVASGGIAVTVSRGGQNAVGYGKLRGSSGGGRWSVGGNTCYGTWTAMKRASN
ncbi:MAG TPA: hypothetical protein VMA30_23215 [Xanthobacteraceae bacterium]|nr:hypothetical protein [Xanthobacteraceae bacterium]